MNLVNFAFTNEGERREKGGCSLSYVRGSIFQHLDPVLPGHPRLPSYPQENFSYPVDLPICYAKRGHEAGPESSVLIMQTSIRKMGMPVIVVICVDT